MPSAAQTASASATSASISTRSAGSEQSGPIGSPVSAASGEVAELKIDLVPLRPAGVGQGMAG